MVLDVEEVGAAQVRVAVGLSRPQLGGVDFPLNVPSSGRGQSRWSLPCMSLNRPCTHTTVARVRPSGRVTFATSTAPRIAQREERLEYHLELAVTAAATQKHPGLRG